MQTEPFLTVALGRYPTLDGLRRAVASGALPVRLIDMPTINRAFAPMVREARFDICELALATILQAKAFGKKLVVLPFVMFQRFQQGALLCRADSTRTPGELAGCRVGVRAYSQTTGMWLRGILAEECGLRAEEVRWITFEDSHVAEYRDPPWCERAPEGSDMLRMLRDGALDAVILGAAIPDEAWLRPMFADVGASIARFCDRHDVVPVNHMVVLRQSVLETHPELVRSFVHTLSASFAESSSGDHQRTPSSRAELRLVLELAIRYSTEQALLPHGLSVEDVWDPPPPIG